MGQSVMFNMLIFYLIPVMSPATTGSRSPVLVPVGSPVSVVAFIMLLALTGTASPVFHFALLMLRDINLIIPFIFNEIDGPAAGVILVAVFVPILLMTWRNAQIDGLLGNPAPRRLNHDGLCVDDLRFRIVTDVDVAVESGLTDRDRYTDVRRLRRDRGKDDCEDN